VLKKVLVLVLLKDLVSSVLTTFPRLIVHLGLVVLHPQTVSVRSSNHAQLLLDCLRDCPPISLAKEPGDCLRGLENLLCSWLGEEKDKDTTVVVSDVQQKTSVAAALVALG
jgi:E3 ubiquitin-protein ligase HECTD4